MKKVKITVYMGLSGCSRSMTIEVEDEQTEDEIAEIAFESMLGNLIEWDFEVLN